MKRYDSSIVSLLIAVIFLALSLPYPAEARSVAAKMTCLKDPKSYWLRHSCRDGFVTNIRNKVVAQDEGLNQHDSRVEIMKETCMDFGLGLSGSVKTRLYSPSTKKYICFSVKGQVKTVKRSRVVKMGNLCAFYENPVEEPADSATQGLAYVNLQSAYNAKWYLGFGPEKSAHGRHKGSVLTPEGYEALLPRRMSPKTFQIPRKDKCDFKFSTGVFTPNNQQQDWSGLFQIAERETDRRKTIALENNEILREFSQNFDNNNNEEDYLEEEVEFEKKSVEKRRKTLTRRQNGVSRYQLRGTENLDKISSTSLEDVPPLPSPLALRRRKTKKFRRKTPPSYFYDHNRRRNEKNISTSTEIQVDNLNTPLFSSLL